MTVDNVNFMLNKSLIKDEYEHVHVHDCNEFTFSISAFSDYYGMLPETFNVTGGYPSGEKLFFKLS